MQPMHDNDHVPSSPQAAAPAPISTDTTLAVYMDSIRTVVAPPLLPTLRRRRHAVPLDFTPRRSDHLAKADRGLNSEMKAKRVLLRRLGLLQDDEVISNATLNKYAKLFERPLAVDVIQNVCGLNSGAKCTTVCSVVASDMPSIICLQETELALVMLSLVVEALGPSFDGFFFLPAVKTRGGILLAWCSSVISVSNPSYGSHHISAALAGDRHWWLTGVYGPQSDPEKMQFLADLQEERANCAGPWVLGSDFNMIASPADKNNPRLNLRMLRRFRRFMADLELRDLYLHGFRYTWSNERDNPTLVRIDRVLCTLAWNEAKPHCLLCCLSSAASDHCPLMVDCTASSPGPRRFHFERFWPKMEGFQQVVADGWVEESQEPDPFRRIFLRLRSTARHLQRWSARSIGSISLQLQVARDIIARFDAAQDSRPLSTSESWFRHRLKCAYLGLASIERSILHQRVRLSWLRSGEASSAFLRIHAVQRKQKNRILSLRCGDEVITGACDLSRAAYEHFSAILGTADARVFSLRPNSIDPRHFDLSVLDCPFSKDEVWQAIKLLPTGKAPSPDGFSAEFLRHCWDTVKGDLMEAFDKFYHMNGRGFHCLNEAFITLLAKRPNASSLSDYRPISLIHLVAKLVAKVLALRLAPRLGELLSVNQSAFIAGRCIHDNFMLVQHTARHLHQAGAHRVLLKLDISKAFDSVSWPFLLEILPHLGFSRRWCEWVTILLSTASTRVIMNDSLGPPILHAKGLRQGDQTFGEASGLHSNMAKSSATPIRCSPEEIEIVASELECPITSFPLIYLGLPLSLRKVPASALQPMVDRMATKLSTWRASMLSRGERLALARHVLSAMPTHIMMAIALSVPTLKQINRIISSGTAAAMPPLDIAWSTGRRWGSALQQLSQ
nr:uncharacterized protein LOC109751329 [Aegilops tauschii subsp. strangulata]